MTSETNPSHLELARAFFAAMTVEDDTRVRELCAPGIAPSQNGGAPLDMDSLLGFAKLTHHVAHGFEYADPHLSSTPGGFVQEHVIRGTLADGQTVSVPTCVIGEVNDGRITALREYFDSATGAALMAAIEEAASA